MLGKMLRFSLTGVISVVVLLNAEISTNGQKGLVRTLNAKTIGGGKLSLGIGATYAQDADLVTGSSFFNYGSIRDSDSISVDASIIDPARMLSSDLFMSIGPASFLEFAMSLPFYYDWAGFGKDGGNISDGGLGDLEISAKLLYPPPGKRRAFYASYFLGVSAPTSIQKGFKDKGAFSRNLYYQDNNEVKDNTFYGSYWPNIKPMILWTWDIGSIQPKFEFQIHVNIGGIWSLDNSRVNEAVGRIALEYAPAEMITMFVDVSGESKVDRFTSGFEIWKDPIMLSPGIRINAPNGLFIQIAGDFCVSTKENKDRIDWDPGVDGFHYSTLTQPAWGVRLSFGWEGFLTVQDEDGDGIKDDEDKCPKEPEDFDGFEDSDGCPDYDNDNDGIPDSLDKCPDEAEDKDGFEDEDGCPDYDNDGDGIPDSVDQCPNVAEDFDGFEDKDGCPDYDNDKDGIPDSLDKCPNDPEDFDGFEDEDGCPDIDNDNDGIKDLKDKCPNEPETMNGFEDEDGCPDEKPEKKKAPPIPTENIMRGVQFKSGSSQMTFASRTYLEPLVDIMKKYPSVKIEIRGHTDSLGKYSTNMRLSELRARAVMQYLISKGISGTRMRAVGFGSTNPIADNRTAAGRKRNRRIEIVRVK